MAIDALSTAKYDNSDRRETKNIINELIRSPRGKTGRFLAVTHLTEKIVPGFEDFMSELLLSFDNLPMQIDEVSFAGSGGEQNVFKIKSGDKIFALKIHKLSQMYSGCDFGNQVRRVKNDYRLVCDWFGHIPGFIPKEIHFVGHSPIFGVSALMTIQPFIEEQINGVFEDFTEEKFIDVLGENQNLRKSYLLFSDKLLNLWRRRKCIDLLGEKNLSVLGERVDRLKLYFGDPHVIYDEEELFPGWVGNADRLEERIFWVDNVARQIAI